MDLKIGRKYIDNKSSINFGLTVVIKEKIVYGIFKKYKIEVIKNPKTPKSYSKNKEYKMSETILQRYFTPYQNSIKKVE